MTTPTTYLVRSDWEARVFFEGSGWFERRLEATPAIAGWRELSVRSYTFRAGQSIDGESANDEVSMVLLTGAVTIEIDGPSGPHRWECDGRDDSFAGPPFVLYLPPRHTYRTTIHRDADCVYGRAAATGTRSPRLFRPEDAVATTDAQGNRVHRLLDTATTEHLLCQETIIEPGAWAWLPPHRHDDLEEVTYYRTDPADGWGQQRLFGRAEDVSLTIQHGDDAIVRGGFHPHVAAPTTRLYALTYTAGPNTTWPE